MKIAHIIDGQGGGAAIHVLELAQGLLRRGIAAEIVFFSPGPSVEVATRERVPNQVILKREWGMVFFAWRLWKFIRRNRVEIVHSHTINGNFFARVTGRLAGVPVVTTVHSYIIDELKGLIRKPSLWDRLRYALDLFMSRCSVMMITVSPGIRDRLRERGILPEKIRVIPNGIDLKKFSPAAATRVRKDEYGISERDTVVAINARLVPLKDHRTFLIAARKTAEIVKDVKFLVVGDGPLRQELEQLSRELGVQEKTNFLGWRTDVESILHLVDILVMCSRTEGHGLALLEAMACGKAVVGTDVREINRTIIPGKNGLLVPAADPAALSEALVRLITDPAQRLELGRRARAFVEGEYGMERMLDAYEDVYQAVLRK